MKTVCFVYLAKVLRYFVVLVTVMYWYLNAVMRLYAAWVWPCVGSSIFHKNDASSILFFFFLDRR